jgi:hypothetical protein
MSLASPSIEPRQNALDLGRQIGPNAAAIALSKKPLQPAMLEIADHLISHNVK